MSEQTPKPYKPGIVYWMFTVSMMLFLGVSIFLNVGLAIALALTSPSLSGLAELPEDEFPQFEEVWSYGQGDTKVVHLQLAGLITREPEGTWFDPGYDKVENLVRGIRAAIHDEEIRAIILEVDSPGGGITPSDEIHRELLRFKESADGRKVVIFMRDVAASGAYYAAMAGDQLIAQPTALIGSLGVIIQTLNWQGLSDRMGVTDTTIKSGRNKDLLNPFRASDPEQIAMLQTMVDHWQDHFVTLVASSRNLERAHLEPLADGRVFTANQALAHGLIDAIGYWPEVMNVTAMLLETDALRVVRYHQQTSFWNMLAGFSHQLVPAWARLISPTPRPLYLWQL